MIVQLCLTQIHIFLVMPNFRIIHQKEIGSGGAFKSCCEELEAMKSTRLNNVHVSFTRFAFVVQSLWDDFNVCCVTSRFLCDTVWKGNLF